MSEPRDRFQKRIVGFDGRLISIGDLPPSNTKRWCTSRKALIVTGVRAGLITIEEACERYNLSIEEFLTWQELIDRYGVRGLRVTKIQEYRATSHKNG